MQLQTGTMPNATLQQPSQPQQPTQIPMQVSPMPQQQAQFNATFPQYNQQNQNHLNLTHNDQPMQQQSAQFQLSTEDWSSRTSSASGQSQQTPISINPTPSPNVMHAQSQPQPQPMPCKCNSALLLPSSSDRSSHAAVFAPMLPQQQQQYQAHRSLSPTEPPSLVQGQQQGKPIAPLPKRDSIGVAVMPTGAAQHVASVKNNKIAKTGLKRSYQQVKQEDNSDEDNKRPANTMSRSASAETSAGNSSGNGEDDKKTEKKTPGGHNAVEQKYRRGINDSLITLREIVPALQHLRALPGMENAQRKQSQFSLAASVTPAAPAGFVDGVMAPTKLSKQLILVTATDYIKFLQNRRIELEGELECYKTAIRDCVEDSQVVFGLVESRWSPVRQAILRDRENIYYSRIASKEQSKKQARLERQKNAGSKKADSNNGDTTNAGASLGSDEEDEDDDDEDEDMEDGDNQGTSSAVPSKAQAKARGRKPANNKKASSPRKKANTGSTAPSRVTSNDNSKALMSVFAGVSFVGGAGYDLLFGSSSSASQAGESVSPSQVWSRGNILRRNVISSKTTAVVVQDFPALQAFFLQRPALLSGLVMLSVAVIFGFILFSLLPAVWNRINGSAREAKRIRARATLVQKTKSPASVSLEDERKALAILSGTPSGSVQQILALPLLLSNFIINFFTGSVLSQFGDTEGDVEDLEEAASALRLLELSSEQSYITRMAAFCHLYNLTRSSAWPVTKASIPLLARAQALLALVSIDLFGQRVSYQARSMWKNSQDLLKKEDNTAGWLAFALSASFDEALTAVGDSRTHNPIFQVAEARAHSILLRAWLAVFTDVIGATTFSQSSGMSSSSPRSASSTSRIAQVDEILASMPPSSPSYALALLSKGIQALGVNDKATALKVALLLAPLHSQSLASVRAFSSLVSGQPEAASIEQTSGSVDTLAYSTIAWLSIRQIAKTSLSTTGLSSNGDTEQGLEKNSSDEAGLQVATIRLRKLLANEVFSSNVDEGFADAQDRCVEQLVNIGRQAAGLDALSDSGCEL